jgi:peptide/nickel transport system permease protein
VIETVFTLPLGRLLVDLIFARDYPVVQGSSVVHGGDLRRRQSDRRSLLSPFDPRVAAE